MGKEGTNPCQWAVTKSVIAREEVTGRPPFYYFVVDIFYCQSKSVSALHICIAVYSLVKLYAEMETTCPIDDPLIDPHSLRL